MRELLRALADWLAFFFEDAEYRLVDSEVGQSFGDALATIHALFAPENVAGTAAELRAAKRQRARELFG